MLRRLKYAFRVGRSWRATAVLFRVGLVASLLGSSPVAAHWLPMNDVGLRHDVQLLVDGGVVKGPLGTWPLPRYALARIADRAVPPAVLSAQEADAWRRLYQALHATQGWSGNIAASAAAGKAEPPAQLAWFDRANPQGSQVDLAAGYSGDRFAFRASGQWVEEPVDGETLRADGSFAAVRLGNWLASAGLMTRWWGPGWSGSPIMGNAARPVPGVAVQRADPRPFDVPILKWLGPWTFQAIAGQLESERMRPRANLIAARAVIQPIPRLEIGASRAALWGGPGSPRTPTTFWDVLTGNTNEPDRDVSANQLAGFDARLSFPGHSIPWAAYAHMIGEDEAGMLPSNYFGLLGLESWGRSASGGGYRAFVEYSETTSRFYENRARLNVVYESNSYRTGYRYKDRPIGHPTDGDSRLLTLGWMFTSPAQRRWTALLRLGDLNRSDNPDFRAPWGGNRIANRRTYLVDVEAERGRPLWGGEATVSAGVAWLDKNGRSGNDIEPRVLLGYRRGIGGGEHSPYPEENRPRP